jgi:hypothetical protein
MRIASRFLQTAALAALAVPFVGCSNVDSTNLKTAGIRASMYASTDGSGTVTARVQLMVDDSALAFVSLQDGDALSATVDGQTKPLEQSNVAGIIDYFALLQGHDAEGTEYSFTLDRANDTSASDNHASIPAPFSITSPATGTQTYSRANDEIVVTYDNAGTNDAMSYQLDGQCIQTTDGTISGDSGTFTIPKGSIPKLPNGTEDNCVVELTVMRTRTGTLDSAFAGGGAFGMQHRLITFNSTP